ncbi:hypothetical protein [Streptomyces sp. NPDC056056]|uniref:hypothetical protein n=1 Tax=Streptomyces sp. NPDC056056 TaxID=3345698 RepID=UPI0035D6A624
MTARTMAVRARRTRAQLLDVLTSRLDSIASGRPEPLTPAEAGLLAETIRAHRTEADRVARDRHGLAVAQGAVLQKLRAAEETIREIEQDRDALHPTTTKEN